MNIVLIVFEAVVLLFHHVFTCDPHKYDYIVLWHVLKIMVGPPLVSLAGPPNTFGTAILGGLKKTNIKMIIAVMKMNLVSIKFLIIFILSFYYN